MPGGKRASYACRTKSRGFPCTHSEIENIITPRTPSTQLLYICHESRDAALKSTHGMFKLPDDVHADQSLDRQMWILRNPRSEGKAFGTHIWHGRMKGSKLVTIDPVHDIIYLRFKHEATGKALSDDFGGHHLESFVKRIDDDILHKIRHVAFDVDSFNFNGLGRALIRPNNPITRDLRNLLEMRSLEEVTFICDRGGVSQSSEDFRRLAEPYLLFRRQDILDFFYHLSGEHPEWRLPKIDLVMLRSDLELKLGNSP
jgi:hypothetical protein